MKTETYNETTRSQPVAATRGVSGNGKSALQIKTVLVPLDFSRASMCALKCTIPLAEEFDSAIHLVHVRPVDEFSAIPGAGHLMLNCADALALMQDRLSEIQERHPVHFWPEHCHVVSGRPYVEICQLAEEIKADLIVIPTRGHSGLKHIALGSTAERVVRHAPCPVLIPRGPKFKEITWSGTEVERFSPHRMLVPVDFSDCSIAGLEYAALFAKHFDGKIRLFHAVYPYREAFQIDRAGSDLRPLLQSACEVAEEQMEQLQQLKFMNGIACETEVRVGPAIEEICAASAHPGIDLLITSTHGRTGWKRAIIGSVAEHVIRYAESPVLVVPSQIQPNN